MLISVTVCVSLSRKISANNSVEIQNKRFHTVTNSTRDPKHERPSRGKALMILYKLVRFSCWSACWPSKHGFSPAPPPVIKTEDRKAQTPLPYGLRLLMHSGSQSQPQRIRVLKCTSSISTHNRVRASFHPLCAHRDRGPDRGFPA